MVVMRCEPCQRKMERKRINGSSWVWVCPKCKKRGEVPATAEEVAAFKARRKANEARIAEEKAKADRVAEAESRGEAPEGEDAELWAMNRVLTQDFEHDVGPRQGFYRRMYDDDPFRFAKIKTEREAFVRKETAAVQVSQDDGVDRSLELAEAMLGEVANVERA